MNQPSIPGTPTSIDLPRRRLVTGARTVPRRKRLAESKLMKQTPLAIFVRERLSELGLKQADFCRLNTFDQGMLSRIQNSVVVNLNLESALRLAVGLQVSPVTILELIERPDLHELILLAYANNAAEAARLRLYSGTYAP